MSGFKKSTIGDLFIYESCSACLAIKSNTKLDVLNTYDSENSSRSNSTFCHCYLIFKNCCWSWCWAVAVVEILFIWSMWSIILKSDTSFAIEIWSSGSSTGVSKSLLSSDQWRGIKSGFFNAKIKGMYGWNVRYSLCSWSAILTAVYASSLNSQLISLSSSLIEPIIYSVVFSLSKSKRKPLNQLPSLAKKSLA